ncbi:MAG: DUF5081 family protein [Peptococcaceae bacterium]|nr:DUF5081 family protein [Peptococcaceae bacterium]
MTLKELYYFNGVLDGKDLEFIPRPQMSRVLAQSVKQGLTEQGWLKSATELSEKGLRLVRLIQRYKEAPKHILVDNMVFGVLNNNESIMILHNPFYEEYTIQLVKGSDSTREILKDYTFLQEAENAAAAEPVMIPKDQFENTFELNTNNHLRLQIRHEAGHSSEVYFLSQGILYRYDYDNQILCREDKAETLRGLTARLAF